MKSLRVNKEEEGAEEEETKEEEEEEEEEEKAKEGWGELVQEGVHVLYSEISSYLTCHS